MIDHVGFEVSDLARSARFYDAVFFALGVRRMIDSEHAIAYGDKGSRADVGSLRSQVAGTRRGMTCRVDDHGVDVIVSRELGIPCVVSVTGATRAIPDGAIITVDGVAGTVTVVSVP